MFKGIRRHLAVKLALSSMLAAMLVGAVAFWDLKRTAIEEMRRQADTEARNIGTIIETRLSAELAVAERVPQRIAASLRNGWIGRVPLEQELCSALETSPTLFGSAAALEKNVVAPHAPPFAPYCYRSKSGITLKDLAKGDYNFSTKDWYRISRESGKSVWSEPYFDSGGGETLMVTYSVPIRMRGATDDQIVGVATTDVTLSWLDQFIREIPVSGTGYLFLLGPGGIIVGHPGTAIGEIPTLDRFTLGQTDSNYQQALKMLTTIPNTGKRPMTAAVDPRNGRYGWHITFPLRATNWRAVLFFPEDDHVRAISKFRQHLFIASLVGGLTLVVIMVLVSRSIVRPVTALALATQQVASGQLDAPLPSVQSIDEVGRLTESFREMQQALSHHVDQIRQSAIEKERLEGELRVASRIQMSMIPTPDALSAKNLGCSVYGLLEPALSVGGDLYAVIRRDNGPICFVIGDVSDKGIPAAMLMAVTHTLFKAVAYLQLSPDRILSQINDVLAAQNDADMFVTLQCGVFDPMSGHLSISSGGHPQPVLLSNNASPRFLQVDPGTVVGVEPGLAFSCFEYTLSPGDTLVLYTDGVIEAHDPDLQLFGEDRLIACLAEGESSSGEHIVSKIRRTVQDFAKGQPQFDDIAILTITHS